MQTVGCVPLGPHPTQKPVRVLQHIIKIASNQGDLVFDPFMGVGSTGVAAIKLDRRFLGIEIDEKYFMATEKRLKSIPPDLFEGQKIPMVSDKRPVQYKVKKKDLKQELQSKIAIIL